MKWTEGGELLWFVQMDGFVVSWKRLGLKDDDLRALEMEIMVNPAAAPIIAGTGGVRELRFAPSSWRTGTSGATRVYYAFLAAHGLVLLLFAHAKNVMEAIPADEKRAMKRLLEEIQTYLRQRRPRSQRP